MRTNHEVWYGIGMVWYSVSGSTQHGTVHQVVPTPAMVPHCRTHSRPPYEAKSAGRGTRGRVQSAVCERFLLDMDMAGIYFRSSLGAAGGGTAQLPREQSAVL